MTGLILKASASGGISRYDGVMPVNTHDWCGFPASDAGGGLDAENRLVAVTITATGHRFEFGYDGLGRRVQIRELDPDATQTLQVTSDKKYLWDGVEIAEERDSTGGIVQKRFYSQGFVDSDGTILFYTRDHLGSVRELTDSTQAVRARYDYDPYGRMTKVQGDKDSVFGFTGHFWHAASGLNLTLTRAYDSIVGRWISRDTIGEKGDINLYRYADSDPVNRFDPFGQDSYICQRPIGGKPGGGPGQNPYVSGGIPVTPGWGFGNHQYLCVEINGKMECHGQTMGPGGKGAPTSPKDDYYHPKNCAKLPSNPCFDECLSKKGNGGRPGYGPLPFGPGTDCQEWSENAVKDCAKKCGVTLPPWWSTVNWGF